jgi:hypothetical protein
VEKKDEVSQEKPDGTGAPPASPVDKKPWEEPKLAFVEPKLTKHGNLEKVTHGRKRNGFFGEFSP